MSAKTDKKKKGKKSKKGSLSSRIQDRVKQGAMPVAPQYADDRMPNQFVMPGAQAGNDALAAALNQPMPDVGALIQQQNSGKLDQIQALANAGLLGIVRRDRYGDAQTGSANPFKNGYFRSSEDRMKDPAMTRKAGQYDVPSFAPQQQPQQAPQQQQQAPQQQPAASQNDAVNRALTQLEAQYPVLRNQTPSAPTGPVTQPSQTALDAVAKMSSQYDVTPERLAQVKSESAARSIEEQLADPQLKQFFDYVKNMNNANGYLDESLALTDANPAPWWALGMSGHDMNANRRIAAGREASNAMDAAYAGKSYPTNRQLPGTDVVSNYTDALLNPQTVTAGELLAGIKDSIQPGLDSVANPMLDAEQFVSGRATQALDQFTTPRPQIVPQQSQQNPNLNLDFMQPQQQPQQQQPQFQQNSNLNMDFMQPQIRSDGRNFTSMPPQPPEEQFFIGVPPQQQSSYTPTNDPVADFILDQIMSQRNNQPPVQF